MTGHGLRLGSTVGLCIVVPCLLLVASPEGAAGFIWSPTVVADPQGGYELFFSAYDRALGHECVGRATGPTPLGPFVDVRNTPFLCHTAFGGAIDPSVHSTAGTDYLVWKSDGEGGQPQGIWTQELTNGDQSLAGSPVRLLGPSVPWEADVVEGPTLATVGGTLRLFFSGNKWTSANYAIGVANCSSPLGPCRLATPTPILRSTTSAPGPGGPAIFSVGHQAVMAFAAWPTGRTRSKRVLHLVPLSPTATVQ